MTDPNGFTPPSLRLEELTSPDAGRAIEAGYRTVVVACGAVEQHGPHLPMYMDAEHGERLALMVAERIGRALVAPTIRVGVSAHHMAFPGTVSLSPETFEAICTDYVTSLSTHGFTTVAFLPTHGGNFGPLSQMLPRLQQAAGDGCRVVAFLDLMGLMDAWIHAADEAGGLGERVGGHADVAETSIMLALHPERVRLDRAEDGFHGAMEAGAVQRLIAQGFHTVAPNGILGDARGGSAELGERCMEVAADLAASALRSGSDSA